VKKRYYTFINLVNQPNNQKQHESTCPNGNDVVLNYTTARTVNCTEVLGCI